MNDPFAPLSAKPKDEKERIRRRELEGASHGGKKHRGTRTNGNRFLFGRPPKLKDITPAQEP